MPIYYRPRPFFGVFPGFYPRPFFRPYPRPFYGPYVRPYRPRPYPYR